jgi:hypothetical protein
MIVSSKEYELPVDDIYTAVLADYVNLGLKLNNISGKEEVNIALYWILDHKNAEGFNFQVRQQMTAKLHQKSTLQKTIEIVTGKAVTTKDYELETLIGANARISTITKLAKNGKRYANVDKTMAAKPGAPIFKIPEGYVRHKDRPPQGAPGSSGALQAAEPAKIQAPSAAAQAAVVQSEAVPL